MYLQKTIYTRIKDMGKHGQHEPFLPLQADRLNHFLSFEAMRGWNWSGPNGDDDEEVEEVKILKKEKGAEMLCFLILKTN